MTSNLSNVFGNFGLEYKAQFHVDDVGNSSYITDIKPIDPQILTEDNCCYAGPLHWHIDNLLVYELEDYLVGHDAKSQFGVYITVDILKGGKTLVRVKFPILDRKTAYTTMLHFSAALTGGIINSVRTINHYGSVFDYTKNANNIWFKYSSAVLIIGYEDSNLVYVGLQNDGYLCTALVYNKDLYLFHHSWRGDSNFCKLEKNRLNLLSSY